MNSTRFVLHRLSTVALLAATLAAPLTACAPLLLGGAVFGGTMVFVDRRTTGTQVEDQAIEIKAGLEARRAAPSGHINTTSYNRRLLITGEVASEGERKAAEQAAGRVENVRLVDNELAVAGNTAISARSSDSVITAKVKAGFIDAKDLQAQAIKVVTERGIVYLMGIVTEREASRATDMARTVAGVNKVVRVFEIVSEAELSRLIPGQSPKQ